MTFLHDVPGLHFHFCILVITKLEAGTDLEPKLKLAVEDFELDHMHLKSRFISTGVVVLYLFDIQVLNMHVVH